MTAIPDPLPARRLRLPAIDWTRAALLVGTFLLFVAGWELYARVIYDSRIALPTVSSTARAFVDLTESGVLQEAMASSYWVLVAGSVPGIVLGVAMGLVIGAVRRLDIAFTPIIFAFYATPFPALIPVFILLFGLGVLGKAAIVFALVVTTVLIQTVVGVKSVDATFLEAARSFRSPRWMTLAEVQFPAAMPFIVAGIRIAVGRALVGVIIAEFDTALSGLGALVFSFAGRLQLAEAFVPALVFGVTGVALSLVLRAIEARVQVWRVTS